MCSLLAETKPAVNMNSRQIAEAIAGHCEAIQRGLQVCPRTPLAKQQVKANTSRLLALLARGCQLMGANMATIFDEYLSMTEAAAEQDAREQHHHRKHKAQSDENSEQ